MHKLVIFMIFGCCMPCGKCVWYSQAEGKKSGSRIRQSRMKPFRRKIRNSDFGATPKMVWQNPAQNRLSAQEIFRKNLLREFFGGESIMFQWFDAMAKARELQLSNEKITSVVRVAKHWDQKKTFTDYVWRDEPCLTGLTAWHRQEWWSLTTRRLVAWSVRRKTEYKYRWQIDASFERRTHHVWFYESAR